MATIRDNEFILDLSNIYPTVTNVIFSIKEHRLTDGQPWEGINRISISKGRCYLNVRAGRKGKGYVADWFKSKVSGGKAIVCSSGAKLPGDLNFAFLGDLTLTFLEQQSLTIPNLVIAQGHTDTTNNWWLGSSAMTPLNTISTMDFQAGSVNRFILNETFPNWMSNVNDNVKLSNLSIPGTHDSGTKDVSINIGGARCQNYTIGQQLEDGIRFLDIRLCDKGDELNIYHNKINCNLSFTSVLNQCKSFLEKNSKETIIMLLNSENTDGNITELFLRKYFTNSAYNSLFYKGNKIPFLGEARNHIVPLYRFKIDNLALNKYGLNKENIGVILNGWNWEGKSSDMGGDNFFIQDQYDQHDTHKKYSLVTKYISQSIKDSDTFYINYNSISYQIANGRTPYMYAWGGLGIDPAMNPSLSEYLNSIPEKCKIGTIMLDFYNNKEGDKDNSIIAKIINRN
jgi:1-phosphatidylinositol phosphodiesterase